MSNDFLNNTKARMELLGVPNIFTSFPQFISASRASMYNHHLSQAMVLNNPEFDKIFTGKEENLIDYTFDHSRRKYDCEVVDIIPKYEPTLLTNGLSDCPQIYVIVLTYEPNNVRRLDYFTIDNHFLGTNGFGWIPQFDNRDYVKVGEFIPKEVTLTHSPAVMGDQYAVGTNLNTVYGSFVETIEDSFVLSQTGAKKLATTGVGQVVLDFRQDARFLNTYGDKYTEKFLPDIGSYVRDDGVLCSVRPTNWTTWISDIDPRSLQEPLPLQDKTTYINKPKAKIVDLTFNLNKTKQLNCPEQAQRYVRSNINCMEQIYLTYQKYRHKCDGISMEMSTLVRTAIYRMLAAGKRLPVFDDISPSKLKRPKIEGVNHKTVDFMQVIVTYTYTREVQKGDKLTDFSGAKGIVGAIYPDEWMPIDEDGIRADLMIDMTSPVARNNPAQFYETGINRISEFARRAVEKTLAEHDADKAFDVAVDFYNDINPNYAYIVKEQHPTAAKRKELVDEIIANGHLLWIPPYLDKLVPSPEDHWNALTNIDKWVNKWGGHPSRIKFTSMTSDGVGKENYPDIPFAIGSKYIINLNKIPEITAPGPASVNHIGIPTKNTYETKYTPVSTNPYRLGEDEIRMSILDTDPREVVRLMGLNANSPKAVAKQVETILLSHDPSNIKRVPISNGEIHRTNAILRLTHSTAAALGVETKTTITSPENFQIDDDLSESIYSADIGEYIKDDRENFIDEETVLRRKATRLAKVDKMLETMDDMVGETAAADESDDSLESEED